MAYKIIRIRTNEEQGGSEVTALCDSAEDIRSLGTEWAPGSFAVIADKGLPTYVLNASGSWQEV